MVTSSGFLLFVWELSALLAQHPVWRHPKWWRRRPPGGAMWEMLAPPLRLEKPCRLLALWYHRWCLLSRPLLQCHARKGALLCLLWNAPPGVSRSHHSPFG